MCDLEKIRKLLIKTEKLLEQAIKQQNTNLIDEVYANLDLILIRLKLYIDNKKENNEWGQ